MEKYLNHCMWEDYLTVVRFFLPEIMHNTTLVFLLLTRKLQKALVLKIHISGVPECINCLLIIQNRGVYTGSIIDPGWYTTDSSYVGKLTITRCDNINHIYSGTFFFTAIDPNTGKTVNVTDGRFDVKE